MTKTELTELEFVRSTILKSKKGVGEWAYELNISRQTIYDWLNKPVKIRRKNVYQVAQISDTEIVLKNGKVTLIDKDISYSKKGDGDMPVDAQKIINNQNMQIDLMQEKIDKQTEKISALELNEKINNDEQIYENETLVKMEVSLRFEKFKALRTIHSLSNPEIFAEKLGYSVDEIMDLAQLGKEFYLRDHPIEKMLTNNTIRTLNRYDKDLRGILTNIKSLLTTGIIRLKIPIGYKHKTKTTSDGDPLVVNSLVFCNYNVISNTISTKTVFLNE